jgi:uncharacterized protein (DUF1800 family)
MTRAASPLLAPYSGPWTEREVRHVLNRTGFSARPYEVEAAAGESLDALLDRRINYESRPDNFPRPEWAIAPTAEQVDEMRQAEAKAAEVIKALRKEGQADKKALAKIAKQARALQKQLERRDALTIYLQQGKPYTFDLQEWWLRRMVQTSRPLQEKLTLFWHGHFATSIFKVDSAYYMWLQNETMRRNASGNFRTMIMEISKDPAMIKWLDNDSNNKEHPNENYAREVMELFTLGEGHYSERDIKEAARAFTGWHYDRAAMAYEFNSQQHDDGPKEVLGKHGNWDGGDVVNILFAQPACATFLARKLWTYFAYEEPEPELVDGLAEVFRAGNYQLKPLLRAIFSSSAFFSERAVHTQIKSPVQLVVGSYQLLNRKIPESIDAFSVVVKALRMMGQEPLLPPDVSGWKGGLTWVNTSSLLMRYNFSNFLVNGVPTADMVGLRTYKQEYISDAVTKVREKEKETAISREEQVKRSTTEPLAVGSLADPARFKTSREVVGQLVQLLWDGQSGPEGAGRFIRFLDTREDGTPDPYDPSKPGADRKVRSVIHLMMSTPQYQLC